MSIPQFLCRQASSYNSCGINFSIPRPEYAEWFFPTIAVKPNSPIFTSCNRSLWRTYVLDNIIEGGNPEI
uniref:Uncharacterized protein n=1 Tax=Lotus japonicus TaxID=34305 RepID=I3T3N7_LOTJA|nr:unknown [Lotus japonicus]